MCLSVGLEESHYYNCVSIVRLRLFSWSAFVIVNSIVLGIGIFIRPIADDYCAGFGVKLSPAGYVGRLFTTWSGDLTQIFANFLFVGLPIANFPLPLLGIIVQILSVGLIVSSVFLFLKLTLGWPEKKLSSTSFVLGAAVIEFLWLLYWALPVVLTLNPSYSRILDGRESFSAIQGWSTVIVQYSIVPVALLIILIFLELSKRDLIALWLIFGVILGFSGYVLALASIATILFCRIVRIITRIPRRYFIFIFSCFGAVFISYLSPGARGRSASISPFSFNQFTVEDSTRWFFVSIFEFLSSFANVGILSVVFSVYLLGNIGRARINIEKSSTLDRQLILISSVFLFLYYVLVSISELLTYPAFWHLISFKIFLFILALLTGLMLAKSFPLKRCGEAQSRYIQVVCGLALVVSLLFVIFPANKIIVERGLKWETSTSGLPGISDISEKWVFQCWLDLSELRDLPNRSLNR